MFQSSHSRGGSRIRNLRGFTLIELMIVVVIIGILAAIAIPKFGATRNKAYVAAMKSDLRNLVNAEESYFADSQSYAATTTALGALYGTSVGVTVTIAAGTPTGWTATANHAALVPAKPCFIFGGGAAGPHGLATVESLVACTP